MTAGPETAKVLVASDSTDDARQVLAQITGEYREVRGSADPARAVLDFEDFRPDVLVLAFDSLAKAQRYSLGLYRTSTVVGTHRHANVLLCAKDEVRAAFDLCKSGNFDDYVLHWPQAQDGQRLAMCIWNAARNLFAGAARPTWHELDSHAKRLTAVDDLLQHELAEGEHRLGDSHRALQAAEQAIGAALDAFSAQLSDPLGAAIVAEKDRPALTREVARLKDDRLADAFSDGAARFASAAAWPQQLRQRLEPHLGEMRGFAAAVSASRSTLLVVDDDAFARKLIARTLADQPYDIEFAENGAAALKLLRRIRPALVLMDIRLPDMDGIALTRTLKSAPHLAGIPVLMLTGDARRETLTDSISAGAAGFVVKPFTREALIDKIARVLRPAA